MYVIHVESASRCVFKRCVDTTRPEAKFTILAPILEYIFKLEEAYDDHAIVWKRLGTTGTN